MRIQFICKKNESYGGTYSLQGSGLFNSTRFIVQAMKKRGLHAEIIEVIDNNDIDREITRFRPDVVIVEALWVVPDKFDVLKSLHPKVKWFVHLHSNIPFLASEGIAMEWTKGYEEKGVGIITNSPQAFEAFKPLLKEHLYYLPNIYLSHFREPKDIPPHKTHVDVGCFGAVRPLKNHLIQALASIRFAREIGRRLRFHVNMTRVETSGDPVLRNLIRLFQIESFDSELIWNKWHDPSSFIDHLHHTIDIGLQVSLSETFNVVTADYVTAGLPVVVSKEVKWVTWWCKADDDSIDDIVAKMHRVWTIRQLIWWNQKLLKWNSEEAQAEWFNFFHCVV